MPDKNGKILQEEADKIIAHMAQKFPDGLRCAACNQVDWNLEEHTLTPVPVSPRGLQVLGKTVAYPQVAFMCRNCGHTMFFSAIHLGLFTAEIAAQGAAEPEKPDGN